MFVKLFALLYADDTIWISESASELLNALNVYADYCKKWEPTVNISKTKIIVFSRGRCPNYRFTYSDELLEIVSEFKYLGVLFSRCGSFYKEKKSYCKTSYKRYV